MTSRIPVTFHVAAGRAMVASVAGTLDADSCDDLAKGLHGILDEAARQGQRLVLDVSGVLVLSVAARRTLGQATDHLADVPVLIAGADPEVRQVLQHGLLPGVCVFEHLTDALAAVSGTAPALPGDADAELGEAGSGEAADCLREEVFGLRAKIRTHALIGIAQGMLMTRYGIERPEDAFTLLKEGSQHHNVPLRVLASAVITAPAPPKAGACWFPGRSAHPPAPVVSFQRSSDANPADRHHVLTEALYEIITTSHSDAVALHLTDPAQDDALILEQHHALNPRLRDQYALITGPPAVCARAQQQGAPVTVDDITADLELCAHPLGQALLVAGIRSLHSVPMLTAEGRCSGTVTVHWNMPGSWLDGVQHSELAALADDIATWRSWYRRTVLLDALEYLHQHR
ncbi:ANTAR domain-containing protein [Streptomyces sp. NPDC051920]|uniref:ANTAR domain-containing protein n=1 Tax=Streptomyces sp. NPDC051920 TaxID=3155523 RepID=UPI003412144E